MPLTRAWRSFVKGALSLGADGGRGLDASATTPQRASAGVHDYVRRGASRELAAMARVRGALAPLTRAGSQHSLSATIRWNGVWDGAR